LYKLLFDMKGDLHDLKHLVFELIRGNDLRVPETSNFRTFPANDGDPEIMSSRSWPPPLPEDPYLKTANPDRPSIILDDKKYNSADLADESFALEDMEKDLIRKSLKRHGGRRREAALELGISERTLYRKIKQYDL
nr:sigma-54-dependent Fis family transcriptional regulator [Bacteroidota bacterium]